MRAVKSDDWVPTDRLTLEANALTVAKTTDDRLVVAGPGAGNGIIGPKGMLSASN